MFQTPTAAGISLRLTPTGYLGKRMARPRPAGANSCDALMRQVAAAVRSARSDLAKAKSHAAAPGWLATFRESPDDGIVRAMRAFAGEHDDGSAS